MQRQRCSFSSAHSMRPPAVGRSRRSIRSINPLRVCLSEIGFTIVQHGVTPARSTTPAFASLEAQFFPAIPRDGVGHYTANVVFPSGGDVQLGWSRQGWFGPQDRGDHDRWRSADINVNDQSRGNTRRPCVSGYPVIAALCLVFIVGQSTRDRRRAALR